MKKLPSYLCVGTLLFSVLAFGESSHPKLSPELRDANLPDNLELLVRLKVRPTPAAVDKAVKAGHVVKDILKLTRTLVLSTTKGKLKKLEDDPDVTYVSRNRPVRPLLDYSVEAVGGTIARSYGRTGQGVGIAVVDSGVDPHVDLTKDGRSRIVYAESFVPGSTGKSDSDVLDRFGHGTHVAGIAAGSGAASAAAGSPHNLRGIAPGANIVSLRVLDNQGTGSDATVIAAILRAIDLKDKYNIRVLNLSLGRPVFESWQSDPLCLAVEQAWQAGIVVVTAAGNEGRNNSVGNEGYGTIVSPANHPMVITVGAMKSMSTFGRGDDLIATYSSKGPSAVDHVVKPDLVAPGNRVASLLYGASDSLAVTYPENIVPPSYYGGSASSASYMWLSGTSMAAPVVSGAVALLLEAEPALTPDRVKARLMKTASKQFPTASFSTDPITGVTYHSQYDLFTVGAGYLDIAAALNNHDPATGGAYSPQAVIDPVTGHVVVNWNAWSSGTSAVWGTSAMWGTSAAWGTSAVWGTNVFLSGTSAVWGTSAAWGTSTTQGYSAVWGTSAMWGTSAAWGTSAVWGTSLLGKGE
ncbi:MAG: S8 family serine peptidase [Bryobacterales bacterium]|nr:S8 family serine peptidase [Bryobacterales bacterium]